MNYFTQVQICLEDDEQFPDWWEFSDRNGFFLDLKNLTSDTSTKTTIFGFNKAQYIGCSDGYDFYLSEIRFTDPFLGKTNTFELITEITKVCEGSEIVVVTKYKIYPPLYV